MGFQMKSFKNAVLEAALKTTHQSILIKKKAATIFWVKTFLHVFGLLSVTSGIKFYLLLCVYVLEKGVRMLMMGPVEMFSRYSNHTQEQASSLLSGLCRISSLACSIFFSLGRILFCFLPLKTPSECCLVFEASFFFSRKMGLHLFLQMGRTAFMSFGSLICYESYYR